MKKLFLALGASALIVPSAEAHSTHRPHHHHQHHHQHHHNPYRAPAQKINTCHYHPRLNVFHCHWHKPGHLKRTNLGQFHFLFQF